jgi:hypothetical protein
LYMQFYGIPFMHPYKQPGQWKGCARPAIDIFSYIMKPSI